jgi:hypothetical protein
MGWEGVNPPGHPSGYDPDNKFADPVKYYQHKEAVVADEFVKVAEAKVWTPRATGEARGRRGRPGIALQRGRGRGRARAAVPRNAAPPPPTPSPAHPLPAVQNIRAKLRYCYKNSGVNYQQECRELAKQYLESIKGVGVYRANSGPNDAPRW